MRQSHEFSQLGACICLTFLSLRRWIQVEGNYDWNANCLRLRHARHVYQASPHVGLLDIYWVWRTAPSFFVAFAKQNQSRSVRTGFNNIYLLKLE